MSHPTPTPWDHLRPWSSVLLALVVTLSGCVTEIQDRPKQGPSLDGFDLSRQWTQPVLFHGVPVQFEIEPGENAQMLLPGQGHDLIGIYGDHPRGVEHRFDSLYLQGRQCGEVRDDVGPLMVYLPARAGEPWRRKLDGFELIWDAEEGTCPVEQRVGRRLVWTLVGATVSLESSGRVEIRYGRHSTGTDTLPEGEIVEWDLKELGKKQGGERGRKRTEVLRCPVKIRLGPQGRRR